MSDGSTTGSDGSAWVVCVDFGSTFTKAALVDVDEGRLVATTEHLTTVDSDVLDGWSACRDALVEQHPPAAGAEVLACSSAGGGLRIAVVGNERLVTAEAGRRVALSSGGRVVHVSSGVLDQGKLAALREDRPDVVLLVGGTDGGNSEVLLRCAAALADDGWAGPVVVAGNVDAREQVGALLDAGGTPYVLADNVVPQIGVLRPESARRAIRRMFLAHVIGGKQLSRRPEFLEMVRGPTPDVVLAAVELLARGVPEGPAGAGDVVVVDVGGATTDVYSVIEPVEDETDGGLSHDVVAGSPATRTVEGDLGVRWSAPSTVEAAVAAGLVTDEDAARVAAARRQAEPGMLPTGPTDADVDGRLASWAVGVALRRHAGKARGEHGGVDLREAAVLVGSGGALRHAVDAESLLLTHLTPAGSWQLPEHPRVVVDRDYVLAAAGLLADAHPVAARRLMEVLG